MSAPVITRVARIAFKIGVEYREHTMKHHDRDRTHLSIRASRSVWPFVRLCAWLTLVCCGLATVAPAAEDPLYAASPGGVLSELVERSGLNGGLLLLPRCSDSADALELAEKTPFIVVACSSQEKQVASMREAAAARGLLARRLYAEQMPDSTCPLAENSVSLLLVDDLVESDLTPARHEAWLGAISPRRGVAIVGNRKAEKLDSRKLLDWASAEGAKVEPLSVPGSSFVLIRKPAPEGSDAWTHRFNDPGNQRISHDTTLKAPFSPAWYRLPTNLGYWGDTIVSHGGRAYHIWANRRGKYSVSLICFDIHNGTKLWEQPFKWDKPRSENEAGYFGARACMVALPEGLMMIDEDRLVVIDGERGHELKSIQGPKPGGQMKWIGVEGDLVAVLAGEPDSQFKNFQNHQYPENPFGTELAVYRISDGKLIWKRSESGTVDEREIAIFDGKLYAHARDNRLFCSDLATGKELWSNSDPYLLSQLSEEKTGPYMALSYRILVATPEVLYFASAVRANRVVIDRLNGQLLWSEDVGETRISLNDIILGNTLIKHTKRESSQGTFELKTNKEIDPIKVPAQGCGPSFCTTDFFITMFGKVTDKNGELLRRGDLKAPCDLGVVVADGVAFSPPSSCLCNMVIHGYRAFTSQLPDQGSELLPRHSAGPALNQALSKLDSPSDWLSWRGNNRNSGSLPVEMPSPTPKSKWHWTPVRTNPVPKLPEHEIGPNNDIPLFLPTQAVSANGVVYFGDSQGVIRAVSVEDGRELWNFPVGFKMTVPPALARGRLVVGALNGHIICLDAETGQLAWQYRVPDRKRRVFWYGHLSDTQPLIGGALVHENTVYATAGFNTVDAIRVIALDLASGELKWMKEIPHDDPTGGHLGSLGAMTVANGELFIRSGSQVPASFDLETGKATILPDVKKNVAQPRQGKDIAAVSEDWVIFGGRRSYSDFNRWRKPARFIEYSLCRTDRDLEGKPNKVLGVELSKTSVLMPVFDDELFIAFAEYPKHNEMPSIRVWQRKAYLEIISEINSKPAEAEWLKKQLEEAPFVFGEISSKKDEIANNVLWTENNHLAYTAALGSDALILIHPEDANPRNRLDENWMVSALERSDGSVRWTVTLPGRPVWDGLSLSSDGSILIAMWDGSMLCFK